MYRDIREGERVWVDAKLFVGNSACFLRCLSLQTSQRDAPGSCKARANMPGSGVDSVAELDPGVVTGPLSQIFKPLIDMLVGQLGYSPTDLLAAPYDWRLPPIELDRRDDFFFKLKAVIETAVGAKRRALAAAGLSDSSSSTSSSSSSSSSSSGSGGGGGGSSSSSSSSGDPRAVLIAHSLGNNVVRYFHRWLARELRGDKAARAWCDAHVQTLVGVGAPLLGAAEALAALMTGVTNG
jgi:hypothetical protein